MKRFKYKQFFANGMIPVNVVLLHFAYEIGLVYASRNGESVESNLPVKVLDELSTGSQDYQALPKDIIIAGVPDEGFYLVTKPGRGLPDVPISEKMLSLQSNGIHSHVEGDNGAAKYTPTRPLPIRGFNVLSSGDETIGFEVQFKEDSSLPVTRDQASQPQSAYFLINDSNRSRGFVQSLTRNPVDLEQLTNTTSSTQLDGKPRYRVSFSNAQVEKIPA
tara:strand:- start:11997 stop:12653 length:657 start_codon:yes stop_codon:yes gene_type:complete